MSDSAATVERFGAYIFDNAWDEERERLTALEAGWDPVSIEQLETIGVQRGWRCLEVGAGAGSIARWLAEAVGDAGKVVATDLDTRLLASSATSNLEVREHDIVEDALEVASLDLVHARLLLSHLPAADRALAKMVAALKPGGWLLVEDFDHVTFLPDPASVHEVVEAWIRFITAFTAFSARRGLDLIYGRRLAGLYQAHGLKDITATGHSSLEHGGSHRSRMLSLSIAKLSGGLLVTGEMSEADVNLLRTSLADPSFRWQTQLLVAAKGQAPSAPW